MTKIFYLILAVASISVSSLTFGGGLVSHRDHYFTASGPKVLSLKDAIYLSVRTNPAVKSAYLQRISDKFALEVARNEFEPQYKLDGTVRFQQGSAPDYHLLPGVRLKTPMGTQINIDVDRQIGGNQAALGTFSLTQPLLRGFGSAITLTNLHNAKDNELVNQLNLKSQVISTITQVIQAYHTLIQDYKSLAVDQQALSDSLKTLDSTQRKIKVGKVAETEITQQQAQVANQQFAVTNDKNTILRDYQNLLILLGLDPASKLQIEKELSSRDLFIPEKNACIKMALTNNINYQTQLIALRQLERDIDVQRNQQLPDLTLNASATEDLSDATGGNRQVSLNLSVPIDDKFRQQGLLNSLVGYKKFRVSLENTKRQLETDVINAIRSLEAQRIQIKLAEDSVKYSEQSLQIAQKKFEYGRTTIFEITSLRSTLTSSQINLINQRISYLNTFAQFEQTLGISLERWELRICC
jgi:outer membrane protein